MGKGLQVLVGWKWILYAFLFGFALGAGIFGTPLIQWIWNFLAG